MEACRRRHAWETRTAWRHRHRACNKGADAAERVAASPHAAAGAGGGGKQQRSAVKGAMNGHLLPGERKRLKREQKEVRGRHP